MYKRWIYGRLWDDTEEGKKGMGLPLVVLEGYIICKNECAVRWNEEKCYVLWELTSEGINRIISDIEKDLKDEMNYAVNGIGKSERIIIICFFYEGIYYKF